MFHEIVGKFVRPVVHSKFDLQPDNLNIADDEAAEDVKGQIEPVSGLALIIQYANAKGETSERLVTCQRYDIRADKSYLVAFCHMRQSIRSFRVDRIVEIFDHVSGESQGRSESFFARYRPDGVHKSRFGWGLSVQKRTDLMAFLNSLIFMARCDKEYHPLERNVLEEAICKFWLRHECDNEPDCISIMDHTDRLAPDAETFWVSVNRLAEMPHLLRLLKQTAGDVIAADGKITDEEFYWGRMLDQVTTADD